MNIKVYIKYSTFSFLCQEIFIANSFGDKLRKVPTKELENLLTLINELESENDCKDIEISKQEYQIKKLKDRIAELEKQMCRNEDLHTATEKLNDIIILKQFAERLKEKCEYNRKEYCCEATVSANDIDETLKECLNES